MTNERKAGADVEKIYLGEITKDDIGYEKFLVIHAACNTSLVFDLVNSSVVDPSSGDYRPLKVSRYHCPTHHVSSAPVEEKLGV
jgi:hypothetical protein